MNVTTSDPVTKGQHYTIWEYMCEIAGELGVDKHEFSMRFEVPQTKQEASNLIGILSSKLTNLQQKDED